MALGKKREPVGLNSLAPNAHGSSTKSYISRSIYIPQYPNSIIYLDISYI
jgi:hypothetical protein